MHGDVSQAVLIDQFLLYATKQLLFCHPDMCGVCPAVGRKMSESISLE